MHNLLFLISLLVFFSRDVRPDPGAQRNKTNQAQQTPCPAWGRLANAGSQGEKPASVFFFPGNWRNGVQFYEYNPSSNTHLYTVHPADARHLGWSEQQAYREFAIEQIIQAGFNVINLSYWGPRGTNNWAYWAPMQCSTFAHDECFSAAITKPVTITPYIESYAETPSSHGFSFRSDFPGTAEDPAPRLISHILDLINRYLLTPDNPEWPSVWTQIYDRNGNSRYALSIIHVASDQFDVTDASFAAGFDRIATRVENRTGKRIGFLLDVLPPGTFAPGSFKPSAASTGPYLFESESILGIQCFIPDVWLGSSDENEILDWKENYAAGWSTTGIPYIQDISSGYDAHIVFPASPVYGNNAVWRDGQTGMLQNIDHTGLTFNAWNGYTEALAAVPTLQYGEVTRDWVRDLNCSVRTQDYPYNFSDPGWRLISVPGRCEDMRVSALFPRAYEQRAFAYTDKGYYQPVEELSPFTAYWIKITQSDQVTLTVRDAQFAAHDLSREGWHLQSFGSLSMPVSQLVSEPADALTGPVYGYDTATQSYQPAAAIEPGRGYWIRVSSPCRITVGPAGLERAIASSVQKKSMPPAQPHDRVTSAKSDSDPVIAETHLFPNPFTQVLRITCALVRPAQIRICIYDILGREIRMLSREKKRPGDHTFFWDGRDQTGRRVPSGIYYLHVVAGPDHETQKIIRF